MCNFLDMFNVKKFFAVFHVRLLFMLNSSYYSF